MNEIMTKIFKYYNFKKIWDQNDREFWIKDDSSIVSYFILNYIDCTLIPDDEVAIRKELEKLEDEYIDDRNKTEGIKYLVSHVFENEQEISQIDKNTSAIYLVRFSKLNKLKKYRNLIYAIEESPNYFKRYILPYTETQVEGLNKTLSDYKNKNIVEVLSDLADMESEYYSLMKGTNENSVYELVIRLFSKVPFLQYEFKAISADVSLEKLVKDELKGDLETFNQAIMENITDIDYWIRLDNSTLSEEDVNVLLSKLLDEVG